MPPKKLKYQNVSGMMLARAFSVAIHCTMKRIENRSWAMSPMKIQTISVLGVVEPPMDEGSPNASCLPPFDLTATPFDAERVFPLGADRRQPTAPDASSAIGGMRVRLRSQLTPTRSYSPIRARPRLVYFDAPLSLGRSFTAS